MGPCMPQSKSITSVHDALLDGACVDECRHLLPPTTFANVPGVAVRCSHCGATVSLPRVPLLSQGRDDAASSRPGLKNGACATHRPEREVGP